jgi:hypothetical protein
VFDTLKADGALIYAGPPGRKFLESINTRKTRVRVIGTRQERLTAFQAAKKKAATK